MKTSDIFAAIEADKKAAALSEAEKIKTWDEYAKAIIPIQHLICAKGFRIDNKGIYWKWIGYDCCLKMSNSGYFPDKPFMSIQPAPGTTDTIFCNKEEFEKKILDFCIQYVKSEEEAGDWHEKQKADKIKKDEEYARKSKEMKMNSEILEKQYKKSWWSYINNQ